MVARFFKRALCHQVYSCQKFLGEIFVSNRFSMVNLVLVF